MQELHCAIALSPAFSTVGVGPGGRGIQVCRGWRACRLWACCYDLTYVDHREILLLMSLSFPSCAGTETSAWCSLAQQKTWYNKLDKTCPVCGTRAATSEVPSFGSGCSIRQDPLSLVPKVIFTHSQTPGRPRDRERCLLSLGGMRPAQELPPGDRGSCPAVPHNNPMEPKVPGAL